MKFSCVKKELVKALSVLDNIIENKLVYNIESNILFKVIDNELILSAYNGERYGSYKIAIDNAENGAVAVYSKKILSIIKEMPDGVLCFELSENEKLDIYSENRKTKHLIIGIKPNEFEIREYSDIQTFKIDRSLLIDILQKTRTCVSNEVFKPVLRGFLLKKKNDIFTIVSTNGRMMFIYEYKTNIEYKDFECVVDGALIPIILQSISDNSIELDIGINDKGIIFNIGNFSLYDTFIEGKYPNYKQVIPKEYKYTFKVLKADLLKGIKNIVPMINDVRSKRMILELSNGCLKVVGINQEIGSSTSVVDIEYEDVDFKIAFNYSYLLGIINAFNGETITFELNEGSNPTKIYDMNTNVFSILMPMSIGED